MGFRPVNHAFRVSHTCEREKQQQQKTTQTHIHRQQQPSGHMPLWEAEQTPFMEEEQKYTLKRCPL